jgi:hypothetical protein
MVMAETQNSSLVDLCSRRQCGTKETSSSATHHEGEDVSKTGLP